MEPSELFKTLIIAGEESGLNEHVVMTVMLKIAANLALDCELHRGDFLRACDTTYTVEYFFRPESNQGVH